MNTSINNITTQQPITTTNEGWTNGNINTVLQNPTIINYQGSFSRGGAFKSKGFVDADFYSSSVLVPINKNSQFSMTIESTETVIEKKKSYTVYVIRVQSDQHQWEIVRRYKHFRVFSTQIQNEVNGSITSSLSSLPNTIPTFEFPSKKLIGNMNPNFIKNRKDQLQKFLDGISSSQSAKQSRNLKVFLDPNFSPSLKTIANTSREGYLYLLKPPGKYTSIINSKKQWTKVYCIASNSNLFYWKNREQPYAEANGVIQLCHATTKTIEKQDRTCIEINENINGTTSNGINSNSSNDNSKYLFLSKGKSFSHRIHHNDIINNINNINNLSNNNISNTINNNNNNSSNNNNSNNDIYYLSSDSNAMLEQWISTIEKETFKYMKDSQQQENYVPISNNNNINNNSYNNISVMVNSSISGSTSQPSSIRLGGNKLNRKSIKKIFKDDDVIEEVEFENSNTTTTGDNGKLEKEFILLESVLANSICKDLLIDPNYANSTPNSSTTSSTTSTPSSSFIKKSTTMNTSNNNITTTTTTTNNNNTIIEGALNLLHSESVLYVTERILHMHQNAGTMGSITITNYRFYFQSTVGGKSISIPLALISKIVKCVGFTLDKVKYYAFEMICKDFNRVRFMHLPGSSQQKANSKLLEILESLIFKKSYQQLFCFVNDEILGGDGWFIYNPLKEFERQGIPNEDWRVSKYNNEYTHSPTYPNVLIVPKRITDQELISATTFRSKGRIPTLVWKSSSSNSVIARCSQPVVGVTKKRSQDDEKLIESIRLANPQSEKVYIMDARPQLNAVANQVMGLGYEDTNNESYKNCVLKFLNIENIHKMRYSQKKLFKAIMPDGSASGGNNGGVTSSDSGGNGNVNNILVQQLEDATKEWLEHIRAILYGTLDIVDTIQFFKSSVLVHCSDGWDRTSQLCALAELMLDSYYRTIIGFQVLIEKEWLSYGHKFDSRTGHGSKNDKSEEYSPVFLQFIDCVYQTLNQNPTSFEFNSKYLLEIIHHLYSCRFGTFLYDCQEKRITANLPTKTTSIWSYINQNTSNYLNQNYIPDDSHPLRVDTSDLSLWSEYYLKWRNYYL